MKTEIDTFYLVFLLLIGGVFPVGELEAQSPTDLANMKRLVGNWNTQADRPHNGKAHTLITMDGHDLVAYLVWDADNVPANGLKGDTILLYRFRLQGRRIVGRRVTGEPLTGIVSESFRQIDWEVSRARHNASELF